MKTNVCHCWEGLYFLSQFCKILKIHHCHNSSVMSLTVLCFKWWTAVRSWNIFYLYWAVRVLCVWERKRYMTWAQFHTTITISWQKIKLHLLTEELLPTCWALGLQLPKGRWFLGKGLCHLNPASCDGIHSPIQTDVFKVCYKRTRSAVWILDLALEYLS